MDALQELLAAAAAGPAALESWVGQNRPRVSTALADAVYAQAKTALETGNLGKTAPLFFAAMMLYRVAGPEDKALQSAFNYLQCLYMAADTVPAYDNVRTQLLTIAKRAAEGTHGEIAFNCFVVAADSAFCAADLSDGSPGWLLKSLGDLRDAARNATVPLGPASGQLYTNVAANLWVLAKKADWGTDAAAAEELLVALATESERLVPIGFTLPSDATKTEFIAMNLAALSDEYGNPTSAGARRAAVSS